MSKRSHWRLSGVCQYHLNWHHWRTNYRSDDRTSGEVGYICFALERSHKSSELTCEVWTANKMLVWFNKIVQCLCAHQMTELKMRSSIIIHWRHSHVHTTLQWNLEVNCTVILPGLKMPLFSSLLECQENFHTSLMQLHPQSLNEGLSTHKQQMIDC